MTILNFLISSKLTDLLVLLYSCSNRSSLSLAVPLILFPKVLLFNGTLGMTGTSFEDELLPILC
jgi:hypothetical protein